MTGGKVFGRLSMRSLQIETVFVCVLCGRVTNDVPRYDVRSSSPSDGVIADQINYSSTGVLPVRPGLPNELATDSSPIRDEPSWNE